MSVSVARLLPILAILSAFAIFPFFEGGETPLGLFLVHSVILLSLALIVLDGSSLWIPPFLPYFLPFLLATIASSIVAPYRYAASLQLWDYLRETRLRSRRLYGWEESSVNTNHDHIVLTHQLTAEPIAVVGPEHDEVFPVEFLSSTG